MQESLEPVYVNDEAVAILAYPEKPGNISSAQNIVAMKVRSILGDKQSEIQSGLATRFVSGKRRYLCRAFPIGSGSHNSDRHASFALVLERYVAVPIDISETAMQQLIESLTMCVVARLDVVHRPGDDESVSKPPIEVDQVRVDVVQERPLGNQPQRHRETAAERLHQTPVMLAAPMFDEMGELPPLAAGPFQG